MIYRELDLETVFKKYEEDSYVRLTAMIGAFDASQVPHEVFTGMLAKIFKRTK